MAGVAPGAGRGLAPRRGPGGAEAPAAGRGIGAEPGLWFGPPPGGALSTDVLTPESARSAASRASDRCSGLDRSGMPSAGASLFGSAREGCARVETGRAAAGGTGRSSGAGRSLSGGGWGSLSGGGGGYLSTRSIRLLSSGRCCAGIAGILSDGFSAGFSEVRSVRFAGSSHPRIISAGLASRSEPGLSRRASFRSAPRA